MENPHILSPSSVNTYGTTLDVLPRPDLDRDPETDALLRTIIESMIIVFPKDVINSLQEAFFETLKNLQASGAINLSQVSNDAGNLAVLGSDGGIYVPDRTTVSVQRTSNGTVSEVTLDLDPALFTGPYTVNAAFIGDPGTNTRWWIVQRSANSVTVAYASDNEVPVIVTAQV